MSRKLVLILVDSLRTDMLKSTVAAGQAPNFGELLARGELVEDCVSSFPSVTPVCTSEILTGTRPDVHRIPGMNWYHRAERRYVEYGSSWEATRTFGLFSALYDTVYNMNMGHLSPDALTLYERLADAGLRSACTPFLIYRGRTRHELGLDGLLRRAASAARFHHAVWGPDELFYGELYSSRKIDSPPTLGRPDVRDDYSATAGVELVERDLYDFLLFSLPDNDHYSHTHGPEASATSIAHADECFGRIVEAGGGLDDFLERNAVILMADHSQSDVESTFDLAGLLAEHWQVLRPSSDTPEEAELAVGPSSRAAGIWTLRSDSHGRRLHAGVREAIAAEPGTDLLCWLEDRDGEVAQRDGVGVPANMRAVIASRGGELRFEPGEGLRDRRGCGWDVAGDLGVIGATAAGGELDCGHYPDALGRVWAALHSPFGADILVSATPGFEFVDWGGTTHVPGGSHGSLHAIDSLGPLLTVGVDGERPGRDRWAISDAAGLVASHFGLPASPQSQAAGASR